jgi:hypothetical protein
MGKRNYKEFGLNLLQALGTIFVIILAAGLYGGVAKGCQKSITHRQTAAESWRSQTLGDVTLDLPFAAKRAPALEKQLREFLGSNSSGISDLKVYQGGAKSMEVTVSRNVFAADPIVGLTGIANGALRSHAASLGDFNPPLNASATTVSGLPGRRASYDHQDGSGQRDTFLFALKGRILWQIAVASKVTDATSADAARILGSVSIEN